MERNVYTLRFQFADKEGNTSTFHLYVPIALSIAEIISFLDAKYTTLQNMSDASLTSVKVFYFFDFDNPRPAQIGSDVSSFAVLYYSNGDTYEPIYIPSPEASIFEGEGEYQSIRVDATNPAVGAFNAAIQSCPWPLATPEGEPFPVEYMVGGRLL